MVVDEKDWSIELHKVASYFHIDLEYLVFYSALGVLCCGYICLVVAVRFFVPYSDQFPANMTCARTIPQSVSTLS